MVGGNPLHDAYGFRFWNRMYQISDLSRLREPHVFIHSFEGLWYTLRGIHLHGIPWPLLRLSCLRYPSDIYFGRYLLLVPIV